jgi:transposase
MSFTPNHYCGESDKDLHQKRFLEAFEVSCSIQKAARWANIHRQTHYDWLRKDATYPARFAEARERATQTLEDEAVRRAVEGVRRPVLYRGKQVYIQGKPLFDIEYSDQLLIRLLEAFNPEKYGRRVEQTNLLDLDPEKLSPALLDKISNHLVEKALAGKPPAMIEEAKRRIAAGEEVTVEQLEAGQ